MKHAIAFVALVIMLSQFARALAQTPSPTVPSPSATPACSTPHKPARIVKVVPPDYPDRDRNLAFQVTTVMVEVAIDAHGNVKSEEVVTTSGLAGIDHAALAAGRDSTYAPAFDDCVPVDGWAIYFASFAKGTSIPKLVRFKCLQPNAGASLMRAAVVRWRPDANVIKPVNATVQVSLSGLGAITDATIVQSTGSPDLDRAALDATWRTLFAPACENSKPAASTFGYEVDFDPSAPSPKGTP